MAAAAVVATGPRNQFERVVPLDQTFNDEDYAGKYIDVTLTLSRKGQFSHWCGCAACDFQQCGILTSIVSDAPARPLFKLRNIN